MAKNVSWFVHLRQTRPGNIVGETYIPQFLIHQETLHVFSKSILFCPVRKAEETTHIIAIDERSSYIRCEPKKARSFNNLHSLDHKYL